jgi:hypothetical protein
MIVKRTYKHFSLLLWVVCFVILCTKVSDAQTILDESDVAEYFAPPKVKKRQSPALVASITFVVPGYGQVYNRKYWKLPIVYGALGGMVYFTINNQKSYQSYRDALKLRLNGGVDTVYPNFQNDTVRALRDKYRKKMELNYIGTVGVLILQSLDALVDTHLYNFDVSEDISINLFSRATPSEFLEFPLVSVSASF